MMIACNSVATGGAAIAANIGGHMPEMRGAWVAQALR
jgi:hypothetical protein